MVTSSGPTRSLERMIVRARSVRPYQAPAGSRRSSGTSVRASRRKPARAGPPRGPPQVRGVDGDEQVRGRVVALAAQTLVQLRGRAAAQPQVRAGRRRRSPRRAAPRRSASAPSRARALSEDEPDVASTTATSARHGEHPAADEDGEQPASRGHRQYAAAPPEPEPESSEPDSVSVSDCSVSVPPPSRSPRSRSRLRSPSPARSNPRCHSSRSRLELDLPSRSSPQRGRPAPRRCLGRAATMRILRFRSMRIRVA